MASFNFTLQNDGSQIFNDKVYDGGPFELANHSYNFLIRPKTSFWRFGVRLSETNKIDFYHSSGRHQNESTPDIHFGAGEWDDKDWRLPNRLHLMGYFINDPSHKEELSGSETYLPLSEITWHIKYNEQAKTFDINYNAKNCDPFKATLKVGKDYKFFKIFAWADSTEFNINCLLKIDEDSRNIFFPFSAAEGNYEKTDDQLDFTYDIESFASVISLKDMTPPLAVGLFGQWGSGKSFFMEKLRLKINDNCNLKDPLFIENAIQVKFNAWHYSDSNLWACLITNIFDELNSYCRNNGKENEIEALSKELQITSSQKQLVEIQKNELEIKVRELKNKQREKREQLKDISGFTLLKRFFKDAKIQEDLSVFDNSNIATATNNIDEINRYIKEVKDSQNRFKYFLGILLNLKGKRWLYIIFFALLIFLAVHYLLHFILPTWQQLTLTVSIITTFAVTFIGRILTALRPFFKNINELATRLQSLKKSLITENLSNPELTENEIKLTELSSSLKIIDQKIQEGEKQINDTKNGKKLIEFIETRARDENYAQQLGLISWIRQDFDKLDKLLRDQKQANDNDKAQQNTKYLQLKIDRIILYIDDLDRCSEDTVIKVLEAIHLLLTYQLFVVVVGVDPEWLNKSLDKKYKDFFDASPLEAQIGSNSQKESSKRITTSYDYLEKIFQIPFTLKPVNEKGRNNLIQYLVRNEMAIPENINQIESDQQPNQQFQNPLKELSRSPSTATLELKRIKLTITEEELKYLQKISYLFGNTPRTINRYINSYRIIKAHGNLKILGDYSSKDFIPIMLLLAIVVGYPELSNKLFRRLIEHRSQNMTDFLSKNDGDSNEINSLKLELDRNLLQLSSISVEEFIINLELISRFSFRTLLI